MRLIDADELIKRLEKDPLFPLIEQYNISGVIEKAPTIEAEPVKHGRWVPVTNGRGGFECSICHSYAPSYQDGVEWLSPYCPNCGAKMDLEGEAHEQN